MDSSPASSQTANPDKKAPGFLNFASVQPVVDISFWLKFTQLKLDKWKLEAPPLDIFATISVPMGANSSSDLLINEDSFDDDKSNKELKKIGGLIEIKVSGKFIHFNTIEEY